MEASTKGARWTWAEYARLPEQRGYRQEIIADELFVTPGPRPRHQHVVMRLAAVLHGFVDERGLGKVFPGPIDVIFADGDYLQPDLLFLSTERLHLVSDRGIEGPPDLVMEVASPSTAERDRGIKRERYRIYEVPEYWVIDPDLETVEVWHGTERDGAPHRYHAGDSLVWTPASAKDSLRLAVAAIFAP